MVAERQQITSLKAPPPGWTWDPEAESERRRLRNMQTQFHRERDGRFWPGPRADAIDAVELPSFPADSDRLPDACGHCGSKLLNTEPPLGEHERGLMSCGTCSRSLCWLAPDRTRQPRRSHSATTTKPGNVCDDIVSPMLRPAISTRFNRGPGCSPACSIVYGHDPASHEAFGRRVAIDEFEARPTGIVRTGGMVIDFDTYKLTVDGHDPGLTPTELAIVFHLARRMGLLCLYVEIAEAVWCGEINMKIRRSEPYYMHTLRTNVNRLRRNLGSAGRLVETVKAFGYRLRSEPAIETRMGEPS